MWYCVLEKTESQVSSQQGFLESDLDIGENFILCKMKPHKNATKDCLLALIHRGSGRSQISQGCVRKTHEELT
jgi:hypothetical protein